MSRHTENLRTEQEREVRKGRQGKIIRLEQLVAECEKKMCQSSQRIPRTYQTPGNRFSYDAGEEKGANVKQTGKFLRELLDRENDDRRNGGDLQQGYAVLDILRRYRKWGEGEKESLDTFIAYRRARKIIR